MAGTVRGTFELNAEPASSSLRGLRRESDLTQRSFESTGRALDQMVSADNIAQLEAYHERLKQVNEELFQVTLGARTAESRLSALGRVRATPMVDIRGIAVALAQTEALRARLDQLNRMNVNVRAGISQGLAQRVPQQGIPSATATGLAERVSAQEVGGSAIAGGAGGFVKSGFLFAQSGPFGAGIGGGPGLAGLASAFTLPSYAAIGLAAPAVAPIAGSALGGALGGSAVAAPALGAVGSALTSILTVAMPAAKSIQAASQAQNALNTAVLTYGANSKEAKDATDKLNATLGQTPGLEHLFNVKSRLSQNFQQITAPARQDLFGIMTGGLKTANDLAPIVGNQANRFFGAARPAVGNFEDFLTGRGTTAFLRSMGATSAHNVDEFEHILENIAATFEHIARAARPFFAQGMDFLVEWTGGWRDSTDDIDKTRQWIHSMLKDLEAWGHLGSSGLKLLWDIMMADRRPGRSAVEDLADQLDKWDRWIRHNPREVRRFLTNAVDEARSFATTLGNIVDFLQKIITLLQPVVDLTGQIVNTLLPLGPAALPAALGAFYGIRGARGALRGRVGGAAAGAAPGAAGGGILPIAAGGAAVGAAGAVPAAGTFASARETYALARMESMGRLRGLGMAGGEVLGAGARGFASGALRYYLPAAATLAALQGLTYPGNFGQRVDAGFSAATFGLLPGPKTPQQVRSEALQGLPRNINLRNIPELLAQQQSVLGDTGTALTRAAALGIGGGDKSFFGVDLGFGGATEEERNAAEAKTRFLLRQRAALKTSQAERRAQRAFTNVNDMFTLRSLHGEDPVKAFQNTASDLNRQIDRFSGQARGKFDDLTAAWVNDFNKAHPKLRDETRDTMRDVVRQLDKGKDDWAIISGRIVEINQDNWKKVKNDIIDQSKLAREGAHNNLDAILQEATKFLEQLGFSPSAARQLAHFQSMSSSQQAQAGRQARRNATPAQQHQLHQPQAFGGRPSGRVQGSHMLGAIDHVGVGGALAGGGELFVNRHTEQRADMMLRPYGVTLDALVRGETRSHHLTPFAYGGRRFASGGRYPGGQAEQQARRLAEQMGMSIGEGPGYGIPSSGHAADSLHYSGLAYDVSGSASQMRKYFLTAWRMFHGYINELFYDPMGYYYDQGHRVSGAIGDHSDHVHIGFFPGGNRVRGAARMGGGMGAPIQQIPPLHPLQTSAQGMVAGGVNAANRGQANALRSRINEELRKQAGGAGAIRGGGPVMAQIYRVLKAGGLNKVGAAGIIGNAYAESSLDPSATGYGGGGLWGFTASPNSLSDLQAYAQKAHMPWTSAGLQTQFLLQHVDQGLIRSLNAAGSPAAAAELFMTQWERPGIPRLDVRQAGAMRAFKAGYGYGGRSAGWLGDGGSFMANGPTIWGAGERGPERVTVEPLGKRRGGGHTFHNTFHINNPQMRTDADLDKLADRLSKKVAKSMEQAFDATDGSGVLGVT